MKVFPFILFKKHMILSFKYQWRPRLGWSVIPCTERWRAVCRRQPIGVSLSPGWFSFSFSLSPLPSFPPFLPKINKHILG